jgi:hypothetical protein
MSDVSKGSIFSAAVTGLQGLFARGTAAEPGSSVEGVQHRAALLHVREGRIIEQAARFNGC